jgi:hypothetical protein
VGTRDGREGGLRLDRPYHQDYWYYAGLARSLFSGFPPENPTFAGEPLTQYAFHLAPLAALSKIMSPYAAMRLLNVAYCAAFLLLLRRYFPAHFGLTASCILLTAPPFYRDNPLAIDLATRGFHHFPFFFLLLAALLETRRKLLRLAAAFLLPWAHGMMALAFGPLVVLRTWREARRVAFFYLAGLACAAAGVMVISRGRGAANLLEHVRFEPWEPLLHLLPLGVAFVWARGATPLFLAGSGICWSAAVDWLRYYFLFPVDLGVSLACASAIRGEGIGRRVAQVALVLAFAFFAAGVVRQLGPHRPFDRRPVAAALDWVVRSTPGDAVFLVAPTPREFATDHTRYQNDGFGYWLAEHRDLYVGFYGWAEVVGLPGVERSLRVNEFLSNRAPLPDGVDYVFFGPMEQAMYPGFDPGALVAAYADDSVVIFRPAGG